MTDETVEALRAKRDELLLEREIPLLQAEVNALEQSQSLYESWGSLVDPLEYMRDEPGFGFGPGGVAGSLNLRSDREHGRNVPVFQNETELSAIRGAARLLHDCFPVANGAVMENLLSFILGEGLTCKTIPRPGCPPGLDSDVQGAVEQFYRDNHWSSARREEKFRRTRRDGESVTALYPGSDAGATVRFVEPSQLTEPADPRKIEDWLGCPPSDWTFGVHTDLDDVETIHGYYVQWTDSASDWDYLPASQVHHQKVNVDSNVKRGLSDFYSVQEHLTNVGKLERNVAKGAAILSAIIGIRKYGPGISRSSVQGMIQASAFRQYTQATPLGNVTRNAQKLTPGSFLDMPSGVDYQQSPLANQGVGEAFVTIEQALLRTVGTKWCMPEYMISGDASNANYASTLVAESPFVKYCKRSQRTECTEEELLLWRVLAMACRQGRFRRWGVWELGELIGLVSLRVSGPIVEARDRPAETNRRKILSDKGILSDTTWAAEEGMDIEVEHSLGATAAQTAGPGQSQGVDAVTQQDVQVSPELTLNGAQIAGASAIVTQVAKGEIPRDAGIGQLQVLVNLSAEQAATVMGSAGTSAPTTPNPKPATAGDVGQAATVKESARGGLLRRLWRWYP